MYEDLSDEELRAAKEENSRKREKLSVEGRRLAKTLWQRDHRRRTQRVVVLGALFERLYAEKSGEKLGSFLKQYVESNVVRETDRQALRGSMFGRDGGRSGV